MNRFLIVLIISVLAGIHSFASDKNNSADYQLWFEHGNNAYINQQYDSAISYYNNILELDVHSSELYFNLGNAYFKLNDIPSAILYYEKAKKYAPGDEDILNNLEMANLKTVDRVEGKPELAFGQWWNTFINQQTADNWATWAIVTGFIMLVFLIIYLLSNGIIKKISFFAATAMLLVMISTWTLASISSSYNENNEYAIIFSPSVTVKSAPNIQANKLFVIHEGTKVKIEDSLDEWKKISLMNGNSGWIRDIDLKLI